MSKKVELNSAEKYFIEQNLTRPVNLLALDVNKSEKVVQDYMDARSELKKKDSRVTKLITYEKGCTVFNGAAAEASDEASKENRKLPPARQPHIHIMPKREG